MLELEAGGDLVILPDGILVFAGGLDRAGVSFGQVVGRRYIAGRMERWDC